MCCDGFVAVSTIVFTVFMQQIVAEGETLDLNGMWSVSNGTMGKTYIINANTIDKIYIVNATIGKTYVINATIGKI